MGTRRDRTEDCARRVPLARELWSSGQRARTMSVGGRRSMLVVTGDSAPSPGTLAGSEIRGRSRGELGALPPGVRLARGGLAPSGVDAHAIA